MKLTEKEEKIARLALDKGAKDGERASAANKLIESLYKRGVSVEDIQKETEVPRYTPKYTNPEYAYYEAYEWEAARQRADTYYEAWKAGKAYEAEEKTKPSDNPKEREREENEQFREENKARWEARYREEEKTRGSEYKAPSYPPRTEEPYGVPGQNRYAPAESWQEFFSRCRTASNEVSRRYPTFASWVKSLSPKIKIRVKIFFFLWLLTMLVIISDALFPWLHYLT